MAATREPLRTTSSKGGLGRALDRLGQSASRQQVRGDNARRLAPIAVFAFKRPEHTRQLLASLQRNAELPDSRVVVFLDGPRTEADVAGVQATRDVIAASGIPHLELVERPRNLGLANSIIEGVGGLTDEHGRVIVLEDDLVVSSKLLRFMNDALERYEDAEKVFAISGYMFPIEPPEDTDGLYLPFISSWGWATWKRAWRHFDRTAAGYARLAADPALQRKFNLDGNFGYLPMLELQRAGRIDSWAILWYLSAFLQGGLSLFPARSLIENRGFDVSATPTTTPPPRLATARAHDFEVRRWPEPAVRQELLERVYRCFQGRK